MSTPFSIHSATSNDAPVIAAIHVASQKAGYTGFSTSEYLDSLNTAVYEDKWREWLAEEKTLTLVATDSSGGAAGFVSFGPIRTRLPGDRGIVPQYGAEIYALYVHPDYWRTGAGSTLFKAAARELGDRKTTKVLLWVVKKNIRACAFYEKMDGQRVGKQKVVINGLAQEESAFGWRDIRKIL